MNLFIPLLIMIAALLMAWGFGWLARGKSDGVHIALGVAGVCLLMVLPLVYEAASFDGSCYADDGAVQPCTLSEIALGQLRARLRLHHSAGSLLGRRLRHLRKDAQLVDFSMKD